MKYAKLAKKDFDGALVKFEAFKEEWLKPLKLSAENTKTANERIDKFVEGLGFNIYCEEYIIAMVDYTLCTMADNKEHKNSYLQLIVLITSHYSQEHSEHISDDFKFICHRIFDLYEITALTELFGI